MCPNFFALNAINESDVSDGTLAAEVHGWDNCDEMAVVGRTAVVDGVMAAVFAVVDTAGLTANCTVTLVSGENSNNFLIIRIKIGPFSLLFSDASLSSVSFGSQPPIVGSDQYGVVVLHGLVLLLTVSLMLGMVMWTFS